MMTMTKTNGSSLRVRGRGQCPDNGHDHDRFIPACAGKGCPPVAALQRQSVHPRVCGEGRRAVRHTQCGGGSSPRVRGGGPDASSWAATVAVHPRVCGEGNGGAIRLQVRDGSSPRVRGGGNRTANDDGFSRFIPACAGRGDQGRAGELAQPVHPRVCGEGSWLTANGGAVRRFIPACAGRGVHCSGVCGVARGSARPPVSAGGSTRLAAGSATTAGGPARTTRPLGVGLVSAVV